jgi:hypothetical protein
METTEINQILKQFSESKGNLVQFNEFSNEPEITIENTSYIDVQFIKESIFRVSISALEHSMINDNLAETTNDVIELLKLGSKLSIIGESKFLDDLNNELKKKLNNSSIEKSNNLFWLSDKNAIDPSSKKKNLVKKE